MFSVLGGERRASRSDVGALPLARRLHEDARLASAKDPARPRVGAARQRPGERM
jgi:hypothetical protein